MNRWKQVFWLVDILSGINKRSLSLSGRVGGSKEIGIIRSNYLLWYYLGTKRWRSNAFPSSLTPRGASSMCMLLFGSSDTTMDELHTAGILNTNTPITMCLHNTRGTCECFSSDRTVYENGMAAFPLPFYLLPGYWWGLVSTVEDTERDCWYWVPRKG